MQLQFPSFDSCIIGVEAIITADSVIIYNYVALKKTREKITIEKSTTDITDIEGLVKETTTAYPLLLSIKGKGIVHKKIAANAQLGFDSLLNSVLPNSNIADFYLQSFETDEANRIVSVARKAIVNEILDLLIKQGYKVIGCTLGPFAVQSVLPLLQTENETSGELQFANHELLIRDGQIVNYIQKNTEAEKKDIALGALNVSPELLLAFATAFAYFNPVDSISSNIESTQHDYVEFKNEVKFKTAGVLVLSVSFVLLLANFIAFSYLSDLVKLKSGRVMASSAELSMIDTMEAQIQEKTFFLAKSGLSEPSRTSYYADNIAKWVPEEVKLTGITVHPLIKNEDDTRMEFEAKRILVSGKSKHALDVNDWIKKMRKEKWLKTISLLTYKQKESDKPGEFLIEIKLN